MRTLIKNIGTLAGILPAGVERLQGADMNRMHRVRNAYLLVEDGRIAAFGSMPGAREDDAPSAGESDSAERAGCAPRPNAAADLCAASEPGCAGAAESAPTGVRVSDELPRADTEVDAGGGFVLPLFCDSHTHIVYAGSREGEFADKIAGLSYEDIARRGGGILNSALLLHRTSQDELYRQALGRVRLMMLGGTGSAEIKSGYGLTTHDELKMLRVIRRLAETTPMRIRATFLGAHAVPAEYKGRQDEYVRLICREMIPAVAAEGLADFVDVFCDRGFFTPAETAAIVNTAARYGMRPKIHANELDASGGIEIGVQHGALSVDHLEHTGPDQIAVLKGSRTMPTLLPGAAFFLGMDYPPARRMIDAGLGVALASDFNPGSSPSGNMKLVLSLACIKLRMTPHEAVNAATVNGAYAMGVSDLTGSITVGKAADFMITAPMPSLGFLPYDYGAPLGARIFRDGVEVELP